MGLRIDIVEIDCANPRLLAEFWMAALGTSVELEVELADGPFIQLAPVGEGQPAVAFHQVPEPRVGKNRVHIDMSSDAGHAAEVARLVGLGARVLAERSAPGLIWSVLADPEGNEFCIGELVDPP